MERRVEADSLSFWVWVGPFVDQELELDYFLPLFEEPQEDLLLVRASSLSLALGDSSSSIPSQRAELTSFPSLLSSFRFPPTHASLRFHSTRSLEFLLGRALDNALLNLDIKTQFSDAVHGLGFRLEDLLENERDAGLGNGGLGRLAACCTYPDER